jgi:hypothetical protein
VAAVIGLDEHFFRRGRAGFREFVSMVVDYTNRRLMELAEGRTVAQLEAQLGYIPGRENVRFVVLDICDPFRNFAQRFFPNARLGLNGKGTWRPQYPKDSVGLVRR